MTRKTEHDQSEDSPSRVEDDEAARRERMRDSQRDYGDETPEP